MRTKEELLKGLNGDDPEAFVATVTDDELDILQDIMLADAEKAGRIPFIFSAAIIHRDITTIKKIVEQYPHCLPAEKIPGLKLSIRKIEASNAAMAAVEAEAAAEAAKSSKKAKKPAQDSFTVAAPLQVQ